jgi:hypothetical protein
VGLSGAGGLGGTASAALPSCARRWSQDGLARTGRDAAAETVSGRRDPRHDRVGDSAQLPATRSSIHAPRVRGFAGSRQGRTLQPTDAHESEWRRQSRTKNFSGGNANARASHSVGGSGHPISAHRKTLFTPAPKVSIHMPTSPWSDVRLHTICRTTRFAFFTCPRTQRETFGVRRALCGGTRSDCVTRWHALAARMM